MIGHGTAGGTAGTSPGDVSLTTSTHDARRTPPCDVPLMLGPWGASMAVCRGPCDGPRVLTGFRRMYIMMQKKAVLSVDDPCVHSLAILIRYILHHFAVLSHLPIYLPNVPFSPQVQPVPTTKTGGTFTVKACVGIRDSWFGRRRLLPLLMYVASAKSCNI